MRNLLTCLMIALTTVSCGGLATKTLDNAKDQVVVDFKKQYFTAKKAGDNETELYTRANLVAEAYLQADEQVMYTQWKNVAKSHADKAGIKFLN